MAVALLGGGLAEGSMSGPGGASHDGQSTTEPVKLDNGNLFLPVTDMRIPGRGLGLELTRTYNSQVITPFPHNWDTGLGTWVVENGEASGEGGQNWHPGRGWGDFQLSVRMKTLAQDPEGVSPDLEFYVGWIHFRFKDYENQYQLLLKTTGVLELVKYYVEDGVQERYFWRSQTSLKPSNWNAFTIRMAGSRITVKVNGVLLLNVTDPEPLPPGRIGLEAHRSHVHWDDFTLTDLSTGDSHTHTFNDIPNQEGMFGYGWTSNLEMRVMEDLAHGEETMLVREDGREDHFMRNPDGTYTPPYGIHDQLSRTSGGFTLRRKDGLTRSFDTAGRLTSIRDRNGNALTLTRNSQGRITAVTDPTGRKLTFAYGTNGKVSAVSDPAGRRWTYAYDAARHLTQVTDPLGLTERYAYDPLTHNLTSFTDKAGAVFKYAYTIDDRVKTQTDPVGKTTTFKWEVPFAGLGGTATTRVTNSLGQIWSYRFKLEDETRPDVHDQIHVITDPYGNTEGFAWDTDKNRIGKTDESGRSVFWEYDGRGNPTKIIQFVPPAGSGLSSVSILRYEPTFNQLTALYDPNEHETHFEYDENGNLTNLWRPLNYVDRVQSTFTYNSAGQLLTPTDPLGRAWSFAYDAHGNRTSATDPLGNVTSAAYDILSRPTSVTDPNGQTTRFTWDAGDRLTKVADPLGGETRYTHDGNGNILSVTDPENHKTTLVYDRMGNLTKVTAALGNATLYVWDTADFMHLGASRLTRMTDPKGQVTRYGYDARGRLTQVIDPLGSVTRYEYDQTTHVTSITDANGRVTRFAYDDLERLTQVTDPLGNITRYGYDRLGHLKERTDAEGRKTAYTYDEMDRLKQITYPDGSTVAFAYDKTANRTQMTDSTGITSYTYDALNRPVRIISPVSSQPLTYSYDRVGNQATISSPAGQTAYTYDPLNRLVRLADPVEGVYDFTYDRASRRTQLRYPNALSVTYTYDVADRLTRMKTLNSSLSTLLDLTYTYDKTSNILRVVRGPTGTSGAGATSFTYDALNQLTKATYPGGASDLYTYDKVGNRLTANGVSSTYDAANRLQTTGSVTYGYDKVGNRTSRQSPSSGTVTYAYDGAYRLTSVSSTQPALAQTAVYDGDGNRVTKTVNGVTTRYLNDGLDLLAELDATGASIGVSYVHGPSIDELLATRNHATGQILYHLPDHLGSTAALTNSAGQIQASFTYAAFGATRTKTGPADTRFRFTGRELDAESGLYHYRARAYDPAAGRFLQPDPWPRTPADPRVTGLGYYARLVSVAHPLPGAVPGFLPAGLPAATIGMQGGFLQNPLGLNLYPYVLNNPLRYTDPLGLERGKNTMLQNAAIGLGRVAGLGIGRAAYGALGRVIGGIIGGILGGPSGATLGQFFGGKLGTTYGGPIGSGQGAEIAGKLVGGNAHE
ncbi:MAG: DUF1080 domain-containing protein [Candidatus Omnitrophica bacterium]|nr:DUF1080 domain-containing protein [Candidatus Omnitrophota bacterium]